MQNLIYFHLFHLWSLFLTLVHYIISFAFQTNANAPFTIMESLGLKK